MQLHSFINDILGSSKSPKRKNLEENKRRARVSGCTAKGRKEGSGGKIVHIMAAISYGQLVLIAEPFVKMNGQYFESFIDNDFEFSISACKQH